MLKLNYLFINTIYKMTKDNFKRDDDFEINEYNRYNNFINKYKKENDSIEDAFTNYLNDSIQSGGKKDDLEKELDAIKNEELSYEEQLFKEALKNYQGTDTEKYLLNKYMEYSFKQRNEEEEGLYLIGTNINTIIDMVTDTFLDNIESVEYPGKYKDKKEKKKEEELIAKRKSIQKEKKEQEEKKPYIDRFNEYIDVNYKDVMKNIIGINKDISNVILQPEKVFNERSTFEEILEESKKYQYNNRNINLKALLNMVKVLFKKKKSVQQWLRVASLCETLYVYFNKGQTRELFFESIKELDMNTLLDLEEFWKTDFLFRSNREKNMFRNQLDFYK